MCGWAAGAPGAAQCLSLFFSHGSRRPRPAGFLPGGGGTFYFQAAPSWGAYPLYMAAAPPRAEPGGRRGRGGGGGGDELPGSRGEPPAGPGLQSMDALKARILEAAPGEVRGIIANAAVAPR